MKIAYLFTVHNNFEHFTRLIQGLNKGDCHFFIHFDKKIKVPKLDLPSNTTIIKERVKIYWATYSQVQATLNLLKSSINYDNFDYFIFLSGVDYPIRNHDFLIEKLQEGKEYINLKKGPLIHKPIERLKNYHHPYFDRRKSRVKTRLVFKIEALYNYFFTKNLSFENLYVGSNWFALTRACIEYIFKFLDENKGYKSVFKTGLSPDESFFHTIIGNSKFYEHVENGLTYTDWSGIPAPAIINASHVELFKSKKQFKSAYGLYEPYFSRKFNDDSKKIVNLIEETLRGKDKR